MKINKKVMAGIIGALLAVSCASGGSNKTAVTMDKGSSVPVTVSESTASSDMTANKSTDTNMMQNDTTASESQTTVDSNKKTFTCVKETVIVEYNSSADSVSLTNSKGTYELKRAKAASGELYKDAKGLSIHMKGDEAVYKTSAKAKDVSCKAAE